MAGTARGRAAQQRRSSSSRRRRLILAQEELLGNGGFPPAGSPGGTADRCTPGQVPPFPRDCGATGSTPETPGILPGPGSRVPRGPTTVLWRGRPNAQSNIQDGAFYVLCTSCASLWLFFSSAFALVSSSLNLPSAPGEKVVLPPRNGIASVAPGVLDHTRRGTTGLRPA